jgi:arylsulfatase A-like enzyme
MNSHTRRSTGRSATPSRRDFLKTLAVSAAAAGLPRWAWAEEKRKPNFVVIFCDDLGYADVGCFGAPLIRTPNVDRIAAEGVKLTDFYAAPVCTPSRAQLLTGCYANRVSLPSVLFPGSKVGLHKNEMTLGELLKSAGYATICIGKWHLGHLPQFLPTRHGFDEYFGIPYSNDMRPTPLIEGEKTIEEPAVQATLTERYTQRAVEFIGKNKDKPFFLYLAHTMPHTPLHVSERFANKSKRGLYGDVVECIDWGVGEILAALARHGLEKDTLVIFTSDNGPWLIRGEHGGSAAPLRAGKGTCYEGGMRVPFVARWPARIPQGTVCREMATEMDLLPTFGKLAGAKLPDDRIIDGKDIWPLLSGVAGARTPHEAFFYYGGRNLRGVRNGQWKLMLASPAGKGGKGAAPQAIYDLSADMGEQKDMSAEQPEVVKRLEALVEKCREDLGDAATQRQGKNVRPCGTE